MSQPIGGDVPDASRTARRHRRRAWVVAGVTLAVLLLALTACGDDDDGSDEAVDMCDARDDLEASLQALADVDVLEEGTEAVEAATAEVRTSLDAMATAAGDAIDEEVGDARDAVDDLEQAVASADEASGPAAAVEAVAGAAADLSAAILAIGEELRADCG